MQKFYEKHKNELKTPAVYIGVGLAVLLMGAATGNFDNFATIMLGGGALVFGIRDVVAMYMKDMEELEK